MPPKPSAMQTMTKECFPCYTNLPAPRRLKKESKLPDRVELSLSLLYKAAVPIEGRRRVGGFILAQSADHQLLGGEDREFPKEALDGTQPL